MTYLNWRLDDDEPIEPATPLGEVEIRGEVGRIVDDNLCLDTFFEAMVDALTSLATMQSASLDTLDEPDPLEVERLGERGVRLRFGEMSTDVHDRHTLCSELVVAVSEFLRQLDCASRALNQRPFKFEKLRGFVKGATRS